MMKEERQKKIVEYLLKSKTVKTSFLSKKTGVSEVTIRKDLKELEKEQVLTKTYGGAILEGRNEDFPLNIREAEHKDRKQAIAREAVKLIKENEVIFLDAGTTTLEIAREIRETKFNSLSVATNSLQIANVLAQSQVNLKLIGGDLRKDTMSFIGPDAAAYLNRLHVNKLFLGTSGISLEYGITNTNIFEAELKKTMIKIAREVILVADSSKIDNLAFNKVASLRDIDMMITDKKIERGFLEKVKKVTAVIACEV